MVVGSSEKQFRIAIDGPAGAGKSTLATLLAKTLGFEHINTGLIYRSLSYTILKRLSNRSIEEIEDLIKTENRKVKEIIDDFSPYISNEKVLVEGESILPALKTPRIDAVVGVISKYRIIRERVKIIQKDLISKSRRVVVEGRDIGSSIIPDAELKIYLEASVEERAIRREKERSTKGNMNQEKRLSIEEIEEKIKQRDKADTTRTISPLIKTPDSVVIDNTNLSVEETVRKIEEIVIKRQESK